MKKKTIVIITIYLIITWWLPLVKRLLFTILDEKALTLSERGF